MEIGLIARADNRGLGIQTWEFAEHIRPAKVMVVNCPSAKPLSLRLSRFAEHPVTVVDRIPTRRDMQAFADGLDVAFTAETPYNNALYEMVPTVLQYNYEFLNFADPAPAIYASPSTWNYDDPRFRGTNHCLLPVPIATERFKLNLMPPVHAKRFLHVVGRPAIHDRNGTGNLLQALEYVKSTIRVTIRCQEANYITDMIRQMNIKVPDHVLLVIEEKDTENYWENYRDQDVLVMPRRFGGLCLPAQEAIGAGIPVIMPAIEPNGWLPNEWLVPAKLSGRFQARNQIDVYATDYRYLAERMDEFASVDRVYLDALVKVDGLRNAMSWTALAPLYRAVLDAQV